MSIPTRTTLTEFEAFIASQHEGEKRFELIHGEVIEKVPTLEHGEIVAYLTIELGLYLRQNALGRVVVEGRYRSPEDQLNSRIPDLSILTRDQPTVRQVAAPFMPDLAIEVQSPGDTPKYLREKARYYLAHGTRLVWLIYVEPPLVETYSADDEQLIGPEGLLKGEPLLPGFALNSFRCCWRIKPSP